ncbi:succinic semialdehyde dehydrogenase [Nakamurella multipartita]|uniref:Aldehyde Dehydrogenase n=1 Tax=Nakamurella multipartita (strain ATCC 700099 / DSM 44233 / CIP 104796 / JCM 9543 / NBRC 105858 / Y-104) TaxID=479431 RepID=C8X9V1_NAKMY|nr:succinic semialdehyde dehydrogenase [Nakamurella multipartita]ACV79259.1 Aldehyde Dehydrogenase [Nakamurella multipartita DSM 44233]
MSVDVSGDVARRPSAANPGRPDWLTGPLAQRLAGLITASGATREAASAPYTLTPTVELPRSTSADVQAAFTRARAAQRDWAQRPAGERSAVVLRFHDLLLDRQDQVLDLIQWENGKCRQDAFLEVADIALTARYYGRRAPGLLKQQRRRGAFPVLTRTAELRHPKGVVGVISPWNYPLSLAAGDVIAALLAGNAVVHKPDSQTALTALWAVALMIEAGLPADLWPVVVGSGTELGEPLLAGADYLMFTGSTETGRWMASRAGQRLIGSSLELGGKNALLLLDDADLDRAAAGAARACFASSGQLCISMERIYLPVSRQQAFLDRFLDRVGAMRLGSSYDYEPDMGSLTTAAQLDTVTAHVADARAHGATVLTGGRARPDLGPLFYEPTVLSGVTDQMMCFAGETFGPVVAVYPYQNLPDAIESANATPYGLNASVWTGNPARGRAVAARLHAGTVNVNDGYAAAWASLDAPMGGMGDSGLGRRHGAEGLLKYTEAQTIAEQRILGFTPPPGVSYRAWAKGLTMTLKAMKKAGLS